MAFICPKCDVEFPTVDTLAQHQLEHTVGVSKVSMPPTQEDFERARKVLKSQDKKPPTLPPKEEEKREPPRLEYKWVGICPDCGGEIDTIQVPVSDYVSVVAYCPSCKKQLSQLPVIPIKDQLSKFKK